MDELNSLVNPTPEEQRDAWRMERLTERAFYSFPEKADEALDMIEKFKSLTWAQGEQLVSIGKARFAADARNFRNEATDAAWRLMLDHKGQPYHLAMAAFFESAVFPGGDWGPTPSDSLQMIYALMLDAGYALFAREYIGQTTTAYFNDGETFTQEMYDFLVGPWEAVLGKFAKPSVEA